MKTFANELIEKTVAAFYDAKGNDTNYKSSHGFTTEDGKQVCCFQHQRNNRMVMVYLNDKGILMPFFGEEQ